MRGDPGPAGPQGPIGPRGLGGNVGLPGPKGEVGPAGRDGKDGADGVSVIGPIGPEGPIGPRGERGIPGPPGIGRQGPAGPQGLRGEAGARGERGERGIPGSAGSAGARGDVGPPGPQGPAGATGESGPPGRMFHAKHWKDGGIAYSGEIFVHKGETWQARCDTATEPSDCADWTLLARCGRDARSPTVKGTYDSGLVYHELDIVALNGGSFIARRDAPGPCPGDGWQLIARQGKPGDKGDRGDSGARGAQGEPGIGIRGWKIDRASYVALPVLTDGTIGPALELRGLFEQFQIETG